MVDRSFGEFIWDVTKEIANIRKHGIDFSTAAGAFGDSGRKLYMDSKHSIQEPRYFCVAKVAGRIMTVRFLYRHGKIRIFGAGYWRKGVKLYEAPD